MATLLELLLAENLPVLNATEDGKVITTPDIEITLDQLQKITDICMEYLQPIQYQKESKSKLYRRIIDLSDDIISSRVFKNPNNLSELIIGCRIAALDPMAYVTAFSAPVDGTLYVVVRSNLTDAQIIEELAYVQTTAETTALTAYATSISNFNSIDADWATKSADDLITAIDTAWFGGKTLTQIQADVNASANYKVAMNQLATYLFAFRDDILHKHIRATATLRDYLIRLRRQSSYQQLPDRK